MSKPLPMTSQICFDGWHLHATLEEMESLVNVAEGALVRMRAQVEALQAKIALARLALVKEKR